MGFERSFSQLYWIAFRQKMVIRWRIGSLKKYALPLFCFIQIWWGTIFIQVSQSHFQEGLSVVLVSIRILNIRIFMMNSPLFGNIFISYSCLTANARKWYGEHVCLYSRKLVPRTIVSLNLFQRKHNTYLIPQLNFFEINFLLRFAFISDTIPV